jgi:hypothetical protein
MLNVRQGLLFMHLQPARVLLQVCFMHDGVRYPQLGLLLTAAAG